MPDDLNILASLNSEDPVLRYYTCEKIVVTHSKEIFARLVEMLDDPIDWDCNHYPALKALEALARIDPTGWSWLDHAARAIRRHIETSDLTLAQFLIREIRRALPVKNYLKWIDKFVPEASNADEPWIVTVVNFGGTAWLWEKQFIDGLLIELHGKDRTDLLDELVRIEETYHTLLSRSSDNRALITELIDQLKRWTAEVPEGMRLTAKKRVAEMFLKIDSKSEG